MKRSVKKVSLSDRTRGLLAKLGPNWSVSAALFDQRYNSRDIDAAYRSVPTVSRSRMPARTTMP